ncbi:hypothetical protein MP228_000443 [Amoeboaphelidium protococcarum]|nr:hypothetical protein MP228_000443 [Amoeboaphelidium protococcarum]
MDEGEYQWEKLTRTWDHLIEDTSGNLIVDPNASSSKHRHAVGLYRQYDQSTGGNNTSQKSIVRGIIRQLYLLVDLSSAMLERNDIFKPSLHDCAIRCLKRWIQEFFDSNPVGRIGIIGMRDGVAYKLLDLSGNPQDHIRVLNELNQSEQFKGTPSVQNGLIMAQTLLNTVTSTTTAQSSMSGNTSAPAASLHSSRELLIVMASICTVDPGDIWTVSNQLTQSNVRISSVNLSAEVHVCKRICKQAGGTYRVALDEDHLVDCLNEHLIPPPLSEQIPTSQLKMGFPTRISYPSLCADHHQPSNEGYQCPQCKSKLCTIPTDCVICGLKLISAPHLARSYHHLRPVALYRDVGVELHARGQMSVHCFGCSTLVNLVDIRPEVKPPTSTGQSGTVKIKIKLKSNKKQVIKEESKIGDSSIPSNNNITDQDSRLEMKVFECTRCKQKFCLQCEIFVHEKLLTCPGCN